VIIPKSYHLALQIDRSLKLSLNNEQFETLATFLDGYQDPQIMADSFLHGTPGDVLSVLSILKKKDTIPE
jgi:hypothetical protein